MNWKQQFQDHRKTLKELGAKLRDATSKDGLVLSQQKQKLQKDLVQILITLNGLQISKQTWQIGIEPKSVNDLNDGVQREGHIRHAFEMITNEDHFPAEAINEVLMLLLHELGASASEYNLDGELFSLVIDKAFASSLLKNQELMKELMKNERVEEMVFSNIRAGFYTPEINSVLIKASIASRRAPFLNSLVSSDKLFSFFHQVLVEPGKITTSLTASNLAMDLLDQAQSSLTKKDFGHFIGSSLSRFLQILKASLGLVTRQQYEVAADLKFGLLDMALDFAPFSRNQKTMRCFLQREAGVLYKEKGEAAVCQMVLSFMDFGQAGELTDVGKAFKSSLTEESLPDLKGHKNLSCFLPLAALTAENTSEIAAIIANWRPGCSFHQTAQSFMASLILQMSIDKLTEGGDAEAEEEVVGAIIEKLPSARRVLDFSALLVEFFKLVKDAHSLSFWRLIALLLNSHKQTKESTKFIKQQILPHLKKYDKMSLTVMCLLGAKSHRIKYLGRSKQFIEQYLTDSLDQDKPKITYDILKMLRTHFSNPDSASDLAIDFSEKFVGAVESVLHFYNAKAGGALDKTQQKVVAEGLTFLNDLIELGLLENSIIISIVHKKFPHLITFITKKGNTALMGTYLRLMGSRLQDLADLQLGVKFFDLYTPLHQAKGDINGLAEQQLEGFELFQEVSTICTKHFLVPNLEELPIEVQSLIAQELSRVAFNTDEEEQQADDPGVSFVDFVLGQGNHASTCKELMSQIAGLDQASFIEREKENREAVLSTLVGLALRTESPALCAALARHDLLSTGSPGRQLRNIDFKKDFKPDAQVSADEIAGLIRKENFSLIERLVKAGDGSLIPALLSGLAAKKTGLKAEDIARLGGCLITPAFFNSELGQVDEETKLALLKKVATLSNPLFLATVVSHASLDSEEAPDIFAEVMAACLFDLIYFYFHKAEFKELALQILRLFVEKLDVTAMKAVNAQLQRLADVARTHAKDPQYSEELHEANKYNHKYLVAITGMKNHAAFLEAVAEEDFCLSLIKHMKGLLKGFAATTFEEYTDGQDALSTFSHTAWLLGLKSIRTKEQDGGIVKKTECYTALVRLYIESIQRCRQLKKLATGQLIHLEDLPQYKDAPQEKIEEACFDPEVPMTQDELEQVSAVSKAILAFIATQQKEKDQPFVNLALAITTTAFLTGLSSRSASTSFKQGYVLSQFREEPAAHLFSYSVQYLTSNGFKKRPASLAEPATKAAINLRLE